MTGLANIYIKVLSLFWLLILVTSCAKQIAPKGGERDTTPPNIITSIPLMEAVDYRQSSIEMEFDEYVVTQALLGELVVSPPLKADPEIKMRGKHVVISWKDTLSGNTTYMFQFGEGIKDLNEGNALDSNVFVFSTGPYIDSFSHAGKVIDAFTLQPVEDALVMFYKDNIDSLPRTTLPDYFAKTDKNGVYEINYLADREYKAFVLLPKNKGYTFDLPLESIAFSDTLLQSVYVPDTVPANDSSTIFKLFIEPDTSQYLKGSGQLGTQGIYLSFNQPVQELVVNSLDGTDISNWKERWSDQSDSIVYWFEESIEYDSMRLELTFDDQKDTVFFRKYIVPVRKAKGGKVGGQKSGLDLQFTITGKLLPEQEVSFLSQSPIVENLDFEGVLIIHNSDSIKAKEFLIQSPFSISVAFDFEKGETYSIFFPDSSIVDLFGVKLDSSVYSFSVAKVESLGELTIKHDFPTPITYIYQLLDEKGNLISAQNVQQEGQIIHQHLPPGNYQVQVIFDSNANGFWDSGVYDLKQQPEKIVFYDQKIEVRENWVTEIEWVLAK